MQIHPTIHDAEFPALLQRFVEITGAAEWRRRANALTQQIKHNAYLKSYVQQLYSLELGCAQLLSTVARSGTAPKIGTSAERYRLYAFIAATAMIYERLTSTGRTRLRGQLLGGLRDVAGLTPLQQEITVATHLLARGFDIVFSDMETGGGFDFLARREGIELEVECKRVGLDLGRKITRRDTLDLHRYLKPQLKSVYRNLRCGLFVRVSLPSRLTPNHRQRDHIAALIARAVRTGVGVYEEQSCQISIEDFDIGTSPFVRSGEPDSAFYSAMRHYIEERFRSRNRELMVMFTPAKRALVVSLESAEQDTVLESLFDELSRSASTQFSKTRPALLCVQFVDITNEQITRLDTSGYGDGPARPSALLVQTSQFLADSKRSHVHSIVYRGVGDVGKTSVVSANGTRDEILEQGHAYVIFNDRHALAKDRRYSVFSADPSGAPPSLIIRDRG